MHLIKLSKQILAREDAQAWLSTVRAADVNKTFEHVKPPDYKLDVIFVPKAMFQGYHSLAAQKNLLPCNPLFPCQSLRARYLF